MFIFYQSFSVTNVQYRLLSGNYLNEISETSSWFVTFPLKDFRNVIDLSINYFPKAFAFRNFWKYSLANTRGVNKTVILK